MSRTVVGDLDIKTNRVAFGRGAIAAGQCFDRHQIRFVVDFNCLHQVITCSARVGLITSRRSCRVGDYVSTFTNIHSSYQGNCGSGSRIQSANRPETCRRAVRALAERATGERDARGQLIAQRNIRGLSGALVGDSDLEGDSVPFGWCRVATSERFHGY